MQSRIERRLHSATRCSSYLYYGASTIIVKRFQHSTGGSALALTLISGNALIESPCVVPYNLFIQSYFTDILGSPSP